MTLSETTRRTLLTVALLGAAAMGAVVVAGSARCERYDQILERYRRGQFDDAALQLRELPSAERYRGARQVVGVSLVPFRRTVIEAMLALHTEALLSSPLMLCDSERSARSGATDAGRSPLLAFDYPFFEHGLVETLANQSATSEFLLTWYLTVIAYYHRGGGFGCHGVAPARIQRHPEMQLALGAMHLKVWQWLQNDGWFLPGQDPSLARAEQALRAALDAAPDLYEARVRLADVLLLEGRAEEARANLAEVSPRLDKRFAYVALLLNGRALASLGQFDGAAEAYRAARVMYPHAQSALIALAELAYRRGQRGEALALLGHLEDTSSVASSPWPWDWYDQDSDPREWYSAGVAWRFPTYLAKMRALVLAGKE